MVPSPEDAVRREIVPVSVVIPCFRCSETIRRAFESVEIQTRPPAEIVLVDDGSGDGTLDVLLELKARAPDRLRVIACERNEGAASARNRGLEAAAQPYVAFLDADDSWHPRKLEIQYGWMSLHPEVGLTGHAVRVVEADQTLRRPDADEVAAAPRFHRIRRGALLRSNRFSTPSVLMRRDLPMRFVNRKRHGEDFLLWLEICLSGIPCYFCDLPLAFLHKPHYGHAGLSANLWAMERGELDTYRRLYRKRLIRAHELGMLAVWSLLKYCRRLAMRGLRATTG